MTNTLNIRSTGLAFDTSDLPQPDAYSSDLLSNNTCPTKTDGALPNIADSGRILLGAACRLPTVKALPRPIGSDASVADLGRISMGAACRLPVSK